MANLVQRYEDVPHKQMRGKIVAGAAIEGDAESSLLQRGDLCMLTYIAMAEGFTNTGHTHADHESIGYVLSGRIQMRIGETTYELTEGSTWLHPRGVEHTTFAHEKSVVLEFHVPLRQDILDL